jgi:hypothetical protein
MLDTSMQERAAVVLALRLLQFASNIAPFGAFSYPELSSQSASS